LSTYGFSRELFICFRQLPLIRFRYNLASGKADFVFLLGFLELPRVRWQRCDPISRRQLNPSFRFANQATGQRFFLRGRSAASEVSEVGLVVSGRAGANARALIVEILSAAYVISIGYQW